MARIFLKTSNSSKKRMKLEKKNFLKGKVDLQMKSCFAQQFSLMVVVRQQGDRQHYTHFKPFSLRAPNFNITQSTAAQDVIAYFMK